MRKTALFVAAALAVGAVGLVGCKNENNDNDDNGRSSGSWNRSNTSGTGTMSGGSMSFNSLPASSGTVFVVGNNPARAGQSHVNGGVLKVPTQSANSPILAMGRPPFS